MRAIATSLTLLATGAAQAEEFDYEVIFGFDASNTEVISVFDPGFLPFPLETVQSETETDQYSGGFRWYFDGLSDEIGPRDRAVFTNRASFLEFSGITGEISVSGRVSSGAPGFSDEIDLGGIALAGRKVFENWFFSGSAVLLEADTSNVSFDQEFLQAGVGRYIGETTALSLSAVRTEIDSGLGNDVDSGVALAFNHVGDIYNGWQYGVDVTVSNQAFEGSDASYASEFALYPTKNLSLTLGFQGQLGGSDNDALAVSLGAGWFVTPQLQFEFAFGSTTFDEPEGVDIDSDQYRIQARYRF